MYDNNNQEAMEKRMDALLSEILDIKTALKNNANTDTPAQKEKLPKPAPEKPKAKQPVQAAPKKSSVAEDVEKFLSQDTSSMPAPGSYQGTGNGAAAGPNTAQAYASNGSQQESDDEMGGNGESWMERRKRKKKQHMTKEEREELREKVNAKTEGMIDMEEELADAPEHIEDLDSYLDEADTTIQTTNEDPAGQEDIPDMEIPKEVNDMTKPENDNQAALSQEPDTNPVSEESDDEIDKLLIPPVVDPSMLQEVKSSNAPAEISNNKALALLQYKDEFIKLQSAVIRLNDEVIMKQTEMEHLAAEAAALTKKYKRAYDNYKRVLEETLQEN